jgi:hypothetical protein
MDVAQPHAGPTGGRPAMPVLAPWRQAWAGHVDYVRGVAATRRQNERQLELGIVDEGERERSLRAFLDALLALPTHAGTGAYADIVHADEQIFH